MLQIPSSIPSLVSISSKVLLGLCGSFFIGSKAVFKQLVLSIPKNSFSATRTTASLLLPTKCDLVTPAISLSCITVMGYIFMVVAGLFCILRAKGFASSVHGQPPSPPPQPNSINGLAEKKRGRPWSTWLICIILGLLLGLVALYNFRGTPHNSLATSAIPIQRFSSAERLFFAGLSAASRFSSAVRLHISTHGQRYVENTLLALAGHCGSFLIVLVFGRLCKFGVGVTRWLWLTILCGVVVPFTIMGSFTSLSWVLWILYFWHCDEHIVTTAHEINPGMLRFPSALFFLSRYDPVKISMVLGPAIIHVGTMCIRAVLLALDAIPSTGRVLIRGLSDRDLVLRCLQMSAQLTGILFAYFSVVAVGLQYFTLHPQVQQAVWQAFSSTHARAQVQSGYRSLLNKHEEMKALKIVEFRMLRATTWEMLLAAIQWCAQMWGALCWGHRLLILAPALIFYIYYLLVSMRRRFRNWRRRRRQCASIDGESDDTTKTIPDDIDARSHKGTPTTSSPSQGLLTRVCLLFPVRTRLPTAELGYTPSYTPCRHTL
ncbi:hypothetical protein B0H15DRAFT_952202 [Mycena belliarum]|uniref:Uncharacterized protein n=1 Tax=Mycena belliarum TaxID=1033014 RepID=A0AAD6U386_9AGAR|nr:hypothetical protein B0H15DRAFT_952202 [Mycena belliae]